MTGYFKSTTMVVAGLCWMACAFVIGLFLFEYLVGGAGLQVFGFLLGMSSTTVSIGLVHFVGFIAAACLCFVIGAGLCAHGMVPAPEPEKKTVLQPRVRFAFFRNLIESMRTNDKTDTTLRCVRSEERRVGKECRLR